MNTTKRILVVDDEEDLLEIISEKLEMEGFDNVLTASNGMAAIATIAAGEADLVLSDVRMPLLNGIELLDQVKEMNPNLPFILMTGFADITDSDALSRGAFDLLDKPIKFKELLSTIELSMMTMEDRVKKIDDRDVFAPTSLSPLVTDTKGVRWGRRGFFLPMETRIAEIDINSQVSFEFNCEDFKISGQGSIRWKREEEESPKNGVGVIVEKLADDCYEQVLGQMKQASPSVTIPSE